MSRHAAYCDGLNRRDLVRVGTAGMFGFGYSLPGLLAAQARAAEKGQAKNDVSLIYIFLKGGLSTIDTWDLKPEAPSEFRGEFDPIDTNIAGIQICEHMPRLAGQMDKVSLVRSFTHQDSGHGSADHYMMTGYAPVAGFNPNFHPNNQRPSHGSIIARKLGSRGSVPAYVCLPQMHASGGSAYLGPAASPFSIEADPSAPNFSVPDILPPMMLDAQRLTNRQQLLNKVDRYQQAAEAQANRGAQMVSQFRRQAFDLMTSPEAKRAFDIHAESTPLRDEYGRNSLGQSCLMARRLVEAGVRCVTIDHTNWDTHSKNFESLRKDLLPALDGALPTLLRDLADRGMLEKTLVVVTGEFGRTPRINKDAGRDHWGPSFTVAMAGGGLKGGRVVGSSDDRAMRAADNPYRPEDLAFTIHNCLGIDPNEEFYTPEGRPIKIVNQGKLIRELV